MRIVILHNAVNEQSSVDEKDVLDQVAAISDALTALGHETQVFPCDLNLSALEQQLKTIRPDLVFNLVESLAGRGALIHLVPFLLEALQIPFTGARAEATLLTSNKIMGKTRLIAAGLPTPEWIGPYPAPSSPLQSLGYCPDKTEAVWLIKSVWEHASIGLDEQWLRRNVTPDAVFEEMRRRVSDLGGACFAEEYVDGREFNLSLLSGPEGPLVLPPAEILFEGYEPGKPRIVGYRAKWDSESYEYHHTPRRFAFPESDGPLLQRLTAIALSTWRCFGLTGYARVDFRVDADNRPWILEVNTNPCLSPDAGYQAALETAKIPFTSAVSHILSAARPASQSEAGASAPHNRETTATPTGTPQDIDQPISLRTTVAPEDIHRVGKLVELTGFFYPDEIGVAMELVETYLNLGEASGYRFIFAETGGKLAGYTCYGPIACTKSSYDLYWIAVHPDFQGKGIGAKLIAHAETLTREAGGTRMYAETSNRPQYASTRSFYEHSGYEVVSVLKDYYAPGDDRATYCKAL